MSTRQRHSRPDARMVGSARDENRRVALALGATTFLTMIPVTLIVPVLKELILDRFETTAFWTHSFMSVNMIGAILAVPLIAMLSDRFASRRRTVAIALVLDAAMFWAMSLAPSLAALLAFRALEGAFHILALSTLMAGAADAARPGSRGRMMGLVGACLMVGTACGTRIGGVVWSTWPGLSFEVAAAVALAAAGLAAILVPATPRRTRRSRVAEGLALLRQDRRLWIPYVYTFIDRFCVGVVISSYVLFLALAHEIGPESRSRLLVLFLGPFALLVYPAGRLVDRIGSPFPLVFGSLAFGLLFASYGWIPRDWLAVAMLASGVASALMFAPTLSVCAELAPDGRRGAAFAGFNAAGAFGFVCGPLVAGTVCHLLSGPLGTVAAYRAAFVTAGAAEAFCALVTLPWLLRLRKAGSIDVGNPAEPTPTRPPPRKPLPV